MRLYQARLEAGLCPTCGSVRDTYRKRCSSCSDVINTHNREYRNQREQEGNPLKVYNPTKSKVYRESIKLEALVAYGGSACICCGESNIQFLTLDHVNNDGYHARRKSDGGQIPWAYSSLKARGYPTEPPLQVLCYNCNNGKRVNKGVCPHKVVL